MNRFSPMLRAKTSLKREDFIYTDKLLRIVPGVSVRFSKHIIESVEGSLQRLKMDYVDALLLHRPDTLVDPSEVAEAFDELEKSESSPFWCQQSKTDANRFCFKKYVKQPLLANQLQFGLKHSE